jgi:transmembrane sensor
MRQFTVCILKNGENVMETNDEKQNSNLRQFLEKHSEELSLLSRNDVENAWGKISLHTRQPRSRMWLNVLRYAAIVLVAFLFGVVVTNYAKKTSSPVQYATVAIPDGQMGNLTLPDGTKVFLNSGSTLRYPGRFDDVQRDVYFTGEAYFQVKSDKSHPFLIHLENYTVQVTGTSLNVRAYKGIPVETTLIEGKVNIMDNNGNDLSRLVPGQMFYASDNEMKTQTVNTEVYTMWKDGKLFFDNETLGEISEKLERWYNVEIRFADEKIRQKRLSGTILKSKPFDQILKILTLKESLSYSVQTRSDKPDIVTFSF